LQSYFVKVCKITTGKSLASILVVLSRVIPNAHYSSEINFGAYICEKVDHTFVVTYVSQMVSVL
jgi:hypothetical protein